MDFGFTDRMKELHGQVREFMDTIVIPNEPVYHQQVVESGDRYFHPPVMEDMKAQAKKLLAETGITPQHPLKVEMSVRAIAIYLDMASFVINELKQIGMEATLKQIETAQWHATATRGDYQIGANLTGVGPDDPDANFFENYGCGSPRNYSFYCNEEISKMIEAQSQELDQKKRLALVGQLQKKIEQDAARPLLAWRLDYFTHRPYVKNLIPHQSIYNFGRMQEVWLDK